MRRATQKSDANSPSADGGRVWQKSNSTVSHNNARGKDFRRKKQTTNNVNISSNNNGNSSSNNHTSSHNSNYDKNSENERAASPPKSGAPMDPRMADIVGSLIEYRAKTGSKQIALVLSTKGRFTLQVMNEKKMVFTIHVSKVAYAIKGNYSMGDMLRIAELQLDFKPVLIEKLWEKYSPLDRSMDASVNATAAAAAFFRGTDPLRQFVAAKVMLSHQGKVYFMPSVDPQHRAHSRKLKEGGSTAFDNYDAVRFVPFSAAVVQQNLRDRATLREFRQRYQRVATRIGGPLGGYDDGSSSSADGGDEEDDEGAPPSAQDYSFLSEMPERVERVLSMYQAGLQQIVLKNHKWVRSGHVKYDAEAHAAQVEKAEELLDFLGLSPNAKNARRVLEVTGVWSPHENIEKHLMQIRTHFPRTVLEETKVLLENSEFLIDSDERLRRDLRYLGTYSVDREGTVEVDDALSIERLEDGRDKLWIHIADVSRWIRPGSELSIEAERRMSSIYMPDERICMFPEVLTTDLLSLSARTESYALSCGVTLDERGEVTSYEVCPTRISLDRQLSYTELDYIIDTHVGGLEDSGTTGMQEVIEPLLKDAVENQYTPFGNSLRIKNASNGRQRGEVLLDTYDPETLRDLVDLSKYAKLRHKFRAGKGALDDLVRHRMELHLNVRSNPRNPFAKVSVTGTVNWSNSSSIRTVSEYMILMSQTVGNFCVSIDAPVWYKTQSTNPPLSREATQLREGETPFLRAARVLQHMERAQDSLSPGFHCTSASDAYVQCTSPIRRYHDLYNHYRLKAAMHRASLSEDWADQAEEEAGIKLLDNMATAEERLKTLDNIRMVSDAFIIFSSLQNA